MRRLSTLASVVSLLLFVLALVAEVRSFFAQDVVWFRVSRLGSAVPVNPFDLPSLSSADEGRNVALYDPAFTHLRFDRYWSNTAYELHFSRGRVELQKVEDYWKPVIQYNDRPVQWDPSTHSIGWRMLPAFPVGTHSVAMIRNHSLTDRMVMHTPSKDFPFWPILIATAILPSIWLVNNFRLPKRGHCPQCSYNLTGNTSGVCPECGTRFRQALEAVSN